MFEFALQPEIQSAPNPAEKVLVWAEDLDANALQLEAEAQRVEGLLETLTQPASATGIEMMTELVAVLETQLEGIYGLLEFHQSGDDEVLQQSLHYLLESDSRLQRLELNLEEVRQEVPLLG